MSLLEIPDTGEYSGIRCIFPAFDGSLYFCTDKRVYCMTRNKEIQRIVGTDSVGMSVDGEEALSSPINKPMALFVTDEGTVYVADSGNNLIFKITEGKVIHIIGGKKEARVIDLLSNGSKSTNAVVKELDGIVVRRTGNRDDICFKCHGGRCLNFLNTTARKIIQVPIEETPTKFKAVQTLSTDHSDRVSFFDGHKSHTVGWDIKTTESAVVSYRLTTNCSTISRAERDLLLPSIGSFDAHMWDDKVVSLSDSKRFIVAINNEDSKKRILSIVCSPKVYRKDQKIANQRVEFPRVEAFLYLSTTKSITEKVIQIAGSPFDETIYLCTENGLIYEVVEYPDKPTLKKCGSDRVGRFECNGPLIKSTNEKLYQLITNPDIERLLSPGQLDILQRLLDIEIYSANGNELTINDIGEAIEWLTVMDMTSFGEYCGCYNMFHLFSTLLSTENCAPTLGRLNAICKSTGGKLVSMAKSHCIEKIAFYMRNNRELSLDPVVLENIIEIAKHFSNDKEPLPSDGPHVVSALTLEHLFDKEEASDLIVYVADEKAYCNREILRSTSAYFSAMLQENVFMESSQREYVVSLDEFKEIYHWVIISYCYGRVGSVMTFRNDVDMLKCSLFYDVPLLSNYLSRTVGITKENISLLSTLLYKKGYKSFDTRLLHAAKRVLRADPNIEYINSLSDHLRNDLFIQVLRE